MKVRVVSIITVTFRTALHILLKRMKVMEIRERIENIQTDKSWQHPFASEHRDHHHLSLLPFSPLVVVTDMAVNQGEFDESIGVNLFIMDKSVRQLTRSDPPPAPSGSKRQQDHKEKMRRKRANIELTCNYLNSQNNHLLLLLVCIVSLQDVRDHSSPQFPSSVAPNYFFF